MSLYRIELWHPDQRGAGEWRPTADAPKYIKDGLALVEFHRARHRARLIGPSGQVICDSGYAGKKNEGG